MKYKIAIVGSRGLLVDVAKYVPPKYCKKIISGGAVGIDSCARDFARKYNIPLKEHLPRYDKYGKQAPLICNKLIVADADIIVGFWDGKSRGTIHTIDLARKMGKRVKLYKLKM